MKHYLRFEDWIRRASTVGVITGAIVVLTGWGTGLLTRFPVAKTANAASQPFLNDEGAMPDLDGAIGWLNSPPLNSKSLRGKVVLVNFWTYTCINSCMRAAKADAIRPGLVQGVEFVPDSAPWFQLLSVKQMAEHLYLRYRRTGVH